MSPRRNNSRSGKKHRFHAKDHDPAQEKKFQSWQDERDGGKPRGRKADRDTDREEDRGGGKSTFEFRDRSGKLHSFGGPRGGAGGAAAGRATEDKHRGPRRGPDLGGFADREPKPSHKFGAKARGKKYDEDRFERPAPRRGVSRHTEKPDKRSGPIAQATGRTQKLKATVDKNHKGFAFLIFDVRGVEDVFINPRDAAQLFHGDRVEVTVSGREEIVRIEVLEHRFREIVGRYTPHATSRKDPGGVVVYERKRAREEVYAPKGAPGANPGDWVRASLEFHAEEGPWPVTAEIVEVYGPHLPASSDIQMVASEYNLVEHHSEAAVKEAEAYKLDYSDPHRVDLRKTPFITIDGETARDFDDAVYVEHAPGGHYYLWVAIADVSHYVKDGTALDEEARARGTSVYFPERAFHMLPRALSENLCSLRPHEPRLAMVAKMEYTRAGKRIHTEIMEAVIESKRRATYTEIQKEWEKHGPQDKTWEYAPHFELYQIIRKTRADRGSIDFDLPEAYVICDPTGEPVGIENRERLDAHRLIEEFMIAANEAVTEWAMGRNWPFVYRVHDEPAEQSLDRFHELAASVGVNFSLQDAAESPQVLADLVRRLEGHPAQELLNTQLLRSMKQAVYSAVHSIHYGLGSEGYTHFTSPIRRYPDLIVHRILRRALRTERRQEEPLGEKERQDLEQELNDICEHCSYRERLAADAERESIKLKQTRLMVSRLGEEFEGKINGLGEMGLFVQLFDPFVEGLVSRDTMMDDFYEFNEERMTFTGRRKKRVYRIGDKVKIKVLRADIDTRRIDFGLVELLDQSPLSRDEMLEQIDRQKQHRKHKRFREFDDTPGSGQGGGRRGDREEKHGRYGQGYGKGKGGGGGKGRGGGRSRAAKKAAQRGKK